MIRKFMTTVALGSLFVGGLAASHLAFAQDGGPDRDGPRGGGMMRQADANKDGNLSKAELTAALEARFARLDVDHDGVLTQKDRDAMRQQRLDARFVAMDTDKNGQVSKAEFAAAHAAHAEKRDEMGKGKDGRHWGDRDDRGPGKGMMRGPGGGDANQNGTVTKAEFMAGPLAMFDKADTNKDGVVSAEEMKAARQAMRGEMRGKSQDGDDRKGPPPPPEG